MLCPRSHLAVGALGVLVTLAACKGTPVENLPATTSASSSASSATPTGSTPAKAGDGGSFFDRLPRAPYLPARSVPDNSPGPMSEVEPTVLLLRPQLNECYRTAAKTNPKLEGNAIYAVTIGPDGHPTDVSVMAQDGLEPGVVECAAKAIRGATFRAPPDGQPTRVNVPIAFKPPAAKPDGGVMTPDAGR